MSPTLGFITGRNACSTQPIHKASPSDYPFAMPQDAAESVEQPQHLVLLGRILLTSGIVASLTLFYWLSSLFSIPAQEGFAASLVQQPSTIVAFLVAAIGACVVMVGTGLTYRGLHPDAPVLMTAAGLGVLTVRGGTLQDTLFAAQSPGIFYGLGFEVVVLFAILLGAWMLLNRIRPANALLPAPSEPIKLDEKLLGLFAHASAMAALMIVLCRTDSKDQALCAVGVSSCLAALVAYQVVKLPDSFWFWISPVAVALVGYLYTASHATGWQAGMVHGPIAALARPLPLDYVSMGPLGAIAGYWMAGGGKAEELEEEEVSEAE